MSHQQPHHNLGSPLFTVFKAHCYSGDISSHYHPWMDQSNNCMANLFHNWRVDLPMLNWLTSDLWLFGVTIFHLTIATPFWTGFGSSHLRILVLNSRSKFLTQLQEFSLPHVEVLGPQLVVSGLRDDVVPPLCARGPGPKFPVIIGGFVSHYKLHWLSPLLRLWMQLFLAKRAATFPWH